MGWVNVVVVLFYSIRSLKLFDFIELFIDKVYLAVVFLWCEVPLAIVGSFQSPQVRVICQRIQIFRVQWSTMDGTPSWGDL